MSTQHVDFVLLAEIRDALAIRLGGDIGDLTSNFPIIARDAVDFVLDPVNTARVSISELDNVEKTFIGLKLEHYVRDMLDAPKKTLRDLHLAGHDVDIKNTVHSNWSIPVETYSASEPCILMALDDTRGLCHLGLIVAKPAYLHQGKGNRDTKKGVSKFGFEQIMWLVVNCPFPVSKFAGIDMQRFRELRNTVFPGASRGAAFFRENTNRPCHRTVIEGLLFDQLDPMKRVRGNNGARDILRTEGIAILTSYDNVLVERLGFSRLDRIETMSVRADTPERRAVLEEFKVIDPVK